MVHAHVLNIGIKFYALMIDKATKWLAVLRTSLATLWNTFCQTFAKFCPAATTLS